MTLYESLNQIGAENLTVAGTAVALSGVSGLKPAHALIYVGGGPIRWRADGTSPTSTAGMYAAAGSYIDWTDVVTNYRGLIENVEFIRTTGTSATLAVVYLD